MAILKHITRGGHYGSLNLTGTNINLDRGIVFDFAENETVVIDELRIHNTFVPLTVKHAGRIIIKKIINSKYGGDLIDDWYGGLDIGFLFSRGNHPTRPYDQYHQDIYQSDRLILKKIAGKFRNVSNLNATHKGSRIRKLDVVVKGNKAQGIVQTGKCRNTGSHFGEDGFKMLLDGYPHLLNSYQADNMILGGKENNVNGDIYIRNRYNKNAHATNDVILNNLELNKRSEGDIRVWDTQGLSLEEYKEALRMVHPDYQQFDELKRAA